MQKRLTVAMAAASMLGFLAISAAMSYLNDFGVFLLFIVLAALAGALGIAIIRLPKR